MDIQNCAFWDDMDHALQDLPVLSTQSKQVVKYGNRDTQQTVANQGDGTSRLFSVMCLQSKPTITHRADIKRHLETVLYSLMMKHHPLEVTVWAADWIEKGLLMGSGKPHIDFSLAIANNAQGLMRRTNGGMSHWMSKWVAPETEAMAEDCLDVMKDFMGDVQTGTKAIDAQPNVDAKSWKASAETLTFNNTADETAFNSVNKALFVQRQPDAEKSGGGYGRGRGGGGRGGRGGRGGGFRDKAERNVHDPSKATAKHCLNKECPGLKKFDKGHEIYPEILKRNPGIVLCMQCYIGMLRDEKDVVTTEGNIIKYRKPIKRGTKDPTGRLIKATLAQVVEGEGARALNVYHAYATSLPARSPRRENLMATLEKIPKAMYAGDGNASPEGEDVTQDDTGELLARIAQLERASKSQTKTNTQQSRFQHANSFDALSEEGTGDDDDLRMQQMIEQWVACENRKKNGGSSNNEAAADSEVDTSFFGAMRSARNAKNI
jgi:hypothetical protein